MTRILWLLGSIVLLAAFLRFYQLGENPPSLTWDEVAWGYNAYSLGIDGKDEFGRFLPVQYLESFGDFKPPVYAYLDILPIKIFGLNEFAVRFPSALFGTLTVFITYFLVKRIFHPRGVPQAFGSEAQVRRAQHHLGGVETLALISSFFLAISPWHINLSRAAFEANVATFFLILGVFLFLHAVSRGVASFPPLRWNHIDTLCLPLSMTSFILSMYTFNTARVVAPLLVFVLAIGFKKELFERKKQTMIASIVGFFLVLPLVQFLLTPQAQLRFNEVNIFSDIGVIERTNEEIANDNNAWWSRIIHNRRLAYSVEYLAHYFDHLNPNFLFIKGDGNPKFSTQDVGQLYLWDLPFLVAGILLFLRKREGFWWIILLWLFIGIVPAATARETPHALRIETALPTFQILVAYGTVIAVRRISKIKYQIAKIQIKYLIFVFCFLFLIFNFSYYYHGYYVHYPREFSGEWQYGYKQAFDYVNKEAISYDRVVFTEALGRPYIYSLFYTKENPRVFRETANVSREVYGFVHVEQYGKYVFTKTPSSVTIPEGRVLYVDVPDKIPQPSTILKTFRLLNGKPVLAAYSL